MTLTRKALKPFAKAMSWRVVGVIDTLVIGYVVTGNLALVGSMIGFGVVTHTVLYVAHERAWESRYMRECFGDQTNNH